MFYLPSMEDRSVTIFYETGDVAKRLVVDGQTVYNLVRKGKLPVVATTPRGTRLFDPEAVEKLATERAKKAETARG
jgi:excisionase family DNA binding protein